MKPVIVILAFILLLCPSRSNAQGKYKLHIDAATVYLSGAMLSSSASLKIPAGETELVLWNVATNINTQSIAVSANNNVVVEASAYQANYEPEPADAMRIRKLEDSIEKLKGDNVVIANRVSVLEKQLDILDNNSEKNEKDSNLAPADLLKMLELVGGKMDQYLVEKTKLQERLAKNNERMGQLKQDINDEQVKNNQPGGQLAVRVYAREATPVVINVSYSVPGAGWSPAYDIVADALNKPVKLFYKANVYQFSGLPWDKVQLSLSTGNPTEGVQAPSMTPWYVALYVPQLVVTTYRKPLVDHDNPGSRSLTREEISAMPTTNTSDVVSSSGSVYQAQRGQDVQFGGARTSGALYIIDGIQMQHASSLNNYTTVNANGINASFDIELPYSIPSDGKQHMVAIKKYEMPANYRHYAVPKLDKDAFLQAQLTGWEDMNLLPGPTNIYYEKAYVGQGNIDIRSTNDTMLISLGRDKKVIIKREIDKTLRSTKASGSIIKETFAYTITVRNTRKETINLVLQDQVPVSNDKEVEVIGVESGDSEPDETTGLVTWNLKPAAGETKKINLGFVVKYPDGKTITGLK